MSDLHEKIEIVQNWINTLQPSQPTQIARLKSAEVTLEQIVKLVRRGVEEEQSAQTISETYDDLEKRVQDQTDALTRATSALKSQINERERAAYQLRQAYNDLETHLQEHIAYQSKLNQRLQEQIEEQKRKQLIDQEERALTEALRDTLATMSRTLDLDKILDHILDTVKRVTPYDGANILLVESDLVRVARQKGYLEDGTEDEWMEQRVPLIKLAVLQQLMDMGKPLAIPDTSKSSMWIGFPDLKWIGSNVIAPIRSNGKILGFLSLDSATPGYFTQEHAERLQGFADQAAIAIQNARLLIRAKRSAVLAERNRLAGELHDTISQTLWSMSLVAERMPAIWEVNKDEGRRGLETLHQLAQNALTEMRSLLLELHPSSFSDAKLGELLQQVAEIIMGRTGLEIFVHIDKEDSVPSEVKFALYRVVQEALNNVALHALANRVDIYFYSDSRRIKLSIKDDGRGFDPSSIDAGHLGLSIMTDRIQNIGGTIETISRPGEGTLINVTWIAPAD